jgi:hypothetical protein
MKITAAEWKGSFPKRASPATLLTDGVLVGVAESDPRPFPLLAGKECTPEMSR